MNDESLHIWVLEKLFGPIHVDIIRQDASLRMVHLKDEMEASRTLAVVKFSQVTYRPLMVVHEKILAGGLLGKLLFRSGIEFKKEIVGTHEIRLPTWLKKDFMTREPTSLAVFSNIHIRTAHGEDQHYAEILEVVPPEVRKLITYTAKPLPSLSTRMLALCKALKSGTVNQSLPS